MWYETPQVHQKFMYYRSSFFIVTLVKTNVSKHVKNINVVFVTWKLSQHVKTYIKCHIILTKIANLREKGIEWMKLFRGDRFKSNINIEEGGNQGNLYLISVLSPTSVLARDIVWKK